MTLILLAVVATTLLVLGLLWRRRYAAMDASADTRCDISPCIHLIVFIRTQDRSPLLPTVHTTSVLPKHDYSLKWVRMRQQLAYDQSLPKMKTKPGLVSDAENVTRSSEASVKLK